MVIMIIILLKRCLYGKTIYNINKIDTLYKLRLFIKDEIKSN